MVHICVEPDEGWECTQGRLGCFGTAADGVDTPGLHSMNQPSQIPSNSIREDSKRGEKRQEKPDSGCYKVCRMKAGQAIHLQTNH